jgi:hypothetical protein
MQAITPLRFVAAAGGSPWPEGLKSKESEMSNSVHRSTTSHASADSVYGDAGMEEAGLVQATGGSDRGPAGSEQEQLMLAYGIRHDGRRYCFGNYCSVRLRDAITYARLVARRALYTSDGTGLTRRGDGGGVQPPGGSDRALMASLGVSFDDGRYVFEGSHYSRLADAVAFARLRRVHMY